MFRIRHLSLLASALAASCIVAATAWSATEAPRPFERVGHAPSAATHTPVRATSAQHATGVSTAVVSAAWSALSSGTTVTVGTTFTIGTDAFATIQQGIDAVDAGGTVKVLPGNYTETATGRTVSGYGGTYQFGLYIPITKPGLTVEGVDVSGNPITNYANVGVHVTTNATDDFGPDGVWVDADGVTLSGIDFGPNLVGANKTLSVTGDAFVFKSNVITDQAGGALYFDDVRYDAVGNVSHIQSYRVEGNHFVPGVLISIQDGAGFSGSPANRVITGNRFEMDATDYWPSISFNGSDTGVPWFVYSVGGATITSNTFVNAYPQGQAIRTRGTVNPAQFDWTSYWANNTFDRKVAVGSGPTPLTNLTTYSYPNDYGTFNNCRRIGTGIQGEVDHANPGDVVMVGGGVYPEQVIVNGKNVTIRGAGRGTTTIQSPATLAVPFTTRQPVVTAMGASDIEVTNLTVDGMGLGNGKDFVGVGFWDAGGKLLDCDVTRVRDTPFSGAQEGVAVYASSDNAGPYAIEVGRCNVTDWQKGGIALNENALTVNVHDCTVTAAGPTGVTAQNGIQLWGSSGAITNCAVSGNYWTGGTWVAAGLLLYGPSTVNVSGCTLTDNQYTVYALNTSGTMNGNSITNSSSPGVYAPTALELYNTATSTLAQTARPATANGTRVPPAVQPVTDAGALAMMSRPNSALSNLMTFNVTGGCMTGSGANTEGIDVYSLGAGLQVGITGVELSGWDWGIGTGGAGGVAVNANHNRIAGNLTAGYYAYGPGTNVATLNWWGNAGGPGAGGANPVLGAGVVSSPWLTSGADANPGCGFSAGPDNVVSAGPAPSCLSHDITCITIPVTIARTTSDNIRGYSVTFRLSSNLALCSGTGSVLQGSYLSNVSGTNFEAVDNLDGTYTADCAILGPTCGATAATGTLFTLAVKKNGIEGTGTITLGPIVARDCDNGPVAMSAGSPLSITIDTTAPSAPAALTATQVKSGNDADGTTKIALSFTPPPSATVEVWRAGFGHYPEYDDAGGAVPAIPSAYPPSAPWALTSVTGSGQTDEVATRDYYYYVAYSRDACGNVSAVSTRTSGTLNYHLGDVSNGVTAGQGDNAVNSLDISLLGSDYGVTIGPNDPFNYLDVGPTLDYSVNSRPTTDNKIGFEDLILFSINYSTVSAPQSMARPAAASLDAIALDVPQLPAAGQTFSVPVRMKGAGNVLGASVGLVYDGAVVEPVGVEAGSLLQAQGRGSVVLSPQPGTVDFALLGTGGGIAGEGDVAKVTFRVLAAGAPGIALGNVVARDEQNRTVALGQMAAGGTESAPARTELSSPYPNPALHSASLLLSLARSSSVRLAVYDLAGRRVRTLVDSVQPAGVRTVTWNGANDTGARMAPGVYVIRLEAAGVTQSRRVQFLP